MIYIYKGHSGAIAALTNGPSIALTAVLRFGNESQKKIVSDVIMGRKYIALAITEPGAGKIKSKKNLKIY